MPKIKPQTRTGDVKTRSRKKAPPKAHAMGGVPRIDTFGYDDVLSKLRPIKFSKDDPIKMTIYGRSGTGKTTLCGSFPKPILYLVCSSTHDPNELRSIAIPEYEDTIQALVIRNTLDYAAILNYQAKANEFASVILDNATGLGNLGIKEILGLEVLPEVKDWGMATRDQWGQNSRQTIERLQALFDLNCNIGCVAHERSYKEEAKDYDMIVPYIGPSLGPAAAEWLCGTCDYTVQTLIEQDYEETVVDIAGEEMITRTPIPGSYNYRLRTGPHSVYMTKFRQPVKHTGKKLPPFIDNPTFDKIRDLILAVQ